MSKKIYVGNLPFEVEPKELEELFGQFGKVKSVQLAVDPESGRQKGYGFVEMTEGVSEAVKALHRKKDWDGRWLKVSEVEEETEGDSGREDRATSHAS